MVDNFSNQRDVSLSWLYKLVKYMRVLWVSWLTFEVVFTLFLQFQLHSIYVYLILYILLAVATYNTYWIGLHAFTKARTRIEMIPVHIVPEKSNVYSKSETKDRRPSLSSYQDCGISL